MVPTRVEYGPEYVAAARSVLLELGHLLAPYRQQIVLVGGWVPELLLPDSPLRHVGSLDVDLALDHRTLREPAYRTIEELLLGRGYIPDGRQPFIFFRTVRAGAQEMRVEVDLLAGEYQGTGPGRRTQRVQGLRPRKARGCDLALDLYAEISLRGTLPSGAQDVVSIRVASLVPFLVMKAMALSERLKEKDAWDIYFCLCNHPGGSAGLAAEFEPHLGHGLVNDGLRRIATVFASPTHVGPKSVADFEDPSDLEERARLARDSYERVQDLLRRLGLG